MASFELWLGLTVSARSGYQLLCSVGYYLEYLKFFPWVQYKTLRLCNIEQSISIKVLLQCY